MVCGMTIRTFVRSGLLLAAFSLLSACWTSEEPLVAPEDGADIGISGTFVNLSDPEEAPTTFTSMGDGTYTMTDDEGDTRSTFLSMGDDWYVAQYEVGGFDDEGGESFIIYQPVHVLEDSIELYDAACDQTIEPVYGLELSETSCDLSTIGALKYLARHYIKEVESGEHEDERAIWTPLDDE